MKLFRLKRKAKSIFKGYVNAGLEIYADVKKHSDHLVVFLNGAISRETKTPPVYHRRTWTSKMPCSAIVISDHSVEINNSLELAWYLGKPDGKFLKQVVNTIMQVRDQLGVSNERIIFYGTSGGGYASILLASIIRGARCVAGNPQIDISKYYPDAFEKFISDTGYEITHQKINLIDYLSSKNYIPPITYLQNITDKFHYERHYLPFLTWYAESSATLYKTGPCQFMEYQKTGGHAAVPPSQATIKLLTDLMSSTVAQPKWLSASNRPECAIPFDTFYDTIEIQAVFESLDSKLLIFIDGDITQYDIDQLKKGGFRYSEITGWYKYLKPTSLKQTWQITLPTFEKSYQAGVLKWATKSDVSVCISDCSLNNVEEYPASLTDISLASIPRVALRRSIDVVPDHHAN